MPESNFEYTCSFCGGQITGRREWIGMKTNCPHCQRLITIAEPGAPALGVPAAPAAPAAPDVPDRPAESNIVSFCDKDESQYVCKSCGRTFDSSLQACPFCNAIHLPDMSGKRSNRIHADLRKFFIALLKLIPLLIAITILVSNIMRSCQRSSEKKLYEKLHQTRIEIARERIDIENMDDATLLGLSEETINIKRQVTQPDDIAKTYPGCSDELYREAAQIYSERATMWNDVKLKRDRIFVDQERFNKAAEQLRQRSDKSNSRQEQ